MLRKMTSAAVPTLLILTTALALIIAGCGGKNDGSKSGSVKIDGSSTVGPLTEAVAELYREDSPDVKISVGISGTGGGFEKFCTSETDISDASRPIKDEEKEACKKAGIDYEEFRVANDGITVAVNKENDFAKCLTVDQLNKIWNTKSDVDNWNQIDDSFPDRKTTLYGPGTDSGTFDFFTEAINGEEGASRSDYTASEDDNVLVTGIESDEGGLGYFGYSYFAQNTDRLKAVAVDDGSGCIKPSNATIQGDKYKPLSRPLFIYISSKALSDNQAAEPFVRFYIKNVRKAADNAGLVPPTKKQQNDALKKLDELTG